MATTTTRSLQLQLLLQLQVMVTVLPPQQLLAMVGAQSTFLLLLVVGVALCFLYNSLSPRHNCAGGYDGYFRPSTAAAAAAAATSGTLSSWPEMFSRVFASGKCAPDVLTDWFQLELLQPNCQHDCICLVHCSHSVVLLSCILHACNGLRS